MTAHLSEDVLMDAAEGALLSANDRAHLEACGACRERVGEVRRALELALPADVPEPTPAYWVAFRRQVDDRIRRRERVRRGLLWLPALAAAAVVGVAVLLRSGSPTATPAPLPAWSALPPAQDDARLNALGALSLVADEPGLPGCAGLTECLSEMTDEETDALTESLRAEVPEGMEL